MIDILKEAREYTREEFLNEAAKCGSLFLCPRYSGLNQKCLSIVYDEKKCKECWREAVKDITFKGEELTVICINDKTERDKKIKVLGITEGKEYPVKLCRYPNYYELVNDLGNVETYFIDRFEVLEKPIMEIGEIKFYKNGDVTYPISKEEYKKGTEGDKMEDKTIKVRCIKNDGIVGQITKGKEYPVIEESEEEYLIENDKGKKDTWYKKWLFKKVEDVLIVECVWSDGTVTGNIKYPVIKEYKETYLLKNDLGEEKEYYKTDFKPVEPQKEIKEYSVMELLEEEGTEFKDKRGIIVYPKTIGLNKYLIDKASGTEIRVSEKLLNDKFTKVEEPKPVSTAEAFKALDEGKEIESVISKDKYKKINGTIYIEKEDGDTGKLMYMYRNELEGQWIIIE